MKYLNPIPTLTIFFIIIHLVEIKAQALSTLQNSLVTTQSSTHKLELLIQITQHYANRDDLSSAFEYCAKAIQLNKELEVWQLNM